MSTRAELSSDDLCKHFHRCRSLRAFQALLYQRQCGLLVNLTVLRTARGVVHRMAMIVYWMQVPLLACPLLCNGKCPWF